MEWLPIVASIVLLALGILGLLAPHTVAGLVCIKPSAPMGVTEIRVVYGGIFLGAGAAALYFQEQPMFTMLGLVLGLAALVRLISMWPDRSLSVKNGGSVIGEAVLAVLFLAAVV